MKRKFVNVVKEINGVAEQSRTTSNGALPIPTDKNTLKMCVHYIPTGTMLYCVIEDNLVQVCITEIHYYHRAMCTCGVRMITPSGKKYFVIVSMGGRETNFHFFESKEQYLRYVTGESDAYYNMQRVDLREIVDFSNLSWGDYFYIAAMGYKWRDGRIVNVPLSFGRIVIAGDTAFGEIEKIPENDVYLNKEDAIMDKLGNIEVEEFPESQVKYEIKITISEDGNPKTSKLLKQ